MSSRVPWAGLPAGLAELLRPTLPSAVDATILAISREVPAYRGALQQQIGPTVRRGVEIALGRMLELFGTDEPALEGRAAEFYQRIGAGEYEQGRSLDALLAAYRTGARVSWEHMSHAAMTNGVGPQELVVLAESIFVYIDELSGASAQGHARAGAARSGYHEVLRSQLAQALIDGMAVAAPARLLALADNAGWEITERLAVAIVPKSGDSAGPPLPMAPPDVLVLERDTDAVVVIPDPTGPGRRSRLTERIPGPVFVGTVRPPTEAPMSFAHATALRDLADLGVVPAAGIVLATDHLPELLVGAAPVLAADNRRRALRPLDDLAPPKREVLLETLAAWLALQGDRGAVAADLVVHPQTVSYRMNRLRELFGAQLDDPRGRLTLQLALLSADPPARRRNPKHQVVIYTAFRRGVVCRSVNQWHSGGAPVSRLPRRGTGALSFMDSGAAGYSYPGGPTGHDGKRSRPLYGAVQRRAPFCSGCPDCSDLGTR